MLTAAQLAELGGGGRAAVVVRIGERSARLRVASMGGNFVIGLSKANRTLLGVEIRDEVTAEISLDTAERTVRVPAELAAALARVNGARAAFDALAYTRRKEFAASVVDAKRADTRERRIARILEALAS